jgi:hypothetical protein
MLVEAGWAAARFAGQLRSFFLRVQSRRGQHVVAVAAARKLAILIWHLLTKIESYLWARPALHARKLRGLESQSRSLAGAWPKRDRTRLQPQEPTRPGTTLGQAGRDGLRPFCGRLERKRAEGAHGRRKGGARIKLRGRTVTSCPALCHAVIRARQQISKERGQSIAKPGAVLVMIKTKPPVAVALWPVLTTPARDAPIWAAGAEKRLASAEQRNGLPLPNRETARRPKTLKSSCQSHQWIAAG